MKSGSTEIKMPVSEEGMRCSAAAIRGKGRATSSRARPTSQPSRGRRPARARRASATGRSTRAAMTTRAKTTSRGDSSATATLIKR